MVFSVWAVFLVLTSSATSTELYIGGFYPLTKTFSSWGAGALPAAEIAVNHINNDSSILTNYTLNLVNTDTQGSPGVATRELIKMLQTPPTKIMLLGPLPAIVAQVVAQTARWWNLVQVSPAAFTPALSDRSRYPLFFRTRAALSEFDPARIALLKSFKWKRVAVIARHIAFNIETVDHLIPQLKAAGVEVVTTEIYQTGSQPTVEMTRIKELDTRVIFVLAYEEHARKIFCQAHKHGLTGGRYVWIMHYGDDHRWMDKPTEDGLCTRQELQEAAEGHFVTRDVTAREDNLPAVSGATLSSFLEEYRTMCDRMNISRSDFYAALTYDAVWSMALALNASSTRLQSHGGLESYTYESNHMTDIFMEEMYKLSFEGLSGLVTFSRTGDIASFQTKIQQFRGGNYVTVGEHSSLTDKLVWLKRPSWPGGRIPYDRMQVREEFIDISPALRYTMMSLALAGMAVSAFFLYFNITKSDEKLIKMSSPRLNTVVILGCVLSFGSIVLYSIDGQNLRSAKGLCHLRMMLLCVGFSLGFGALFAKTWRVFKIFTNKSAKKIVIHDFHLFAMVGFFVLLDIFVFILWFALDPIHLTVLEGNMKVDEKDSDFFVLPKKIQCSSSRGHLIQLAFYLIKGILLLFGTFLSWQTHNVSIPALNDSKAIGVAVYNVVVMCCLGVPAAFVLPAFYVDMLYGVVSCCILIATMMTQCIVFLPKMVMLYTGKVASVTNANASHTVTKSTADNGTELTMVCRVCKAHCENKRPTAGTSQGSG